jgi:hypothetical protein
MSFEALKGEAARGVGLGAVGADGGEVRPHPRSPRRPPRYAPRRALARRRHRHRRSRAARGARRNTGHRTRPGADDDRDGAAARGRARPRCPLRGRRLAARHRRRAYARALLGSARAGRGRPALPRYRFFRAALDGGGPAAGFTRRRRRPRLRTSAPPPSCGRSRRRPPAAPARRRSPGDPTRERSPPCRRA